MAPTQPSNGQPGPPHEPVDLESFEGVGRTGGDITAGRNPACEHPLIAAHTPCRQTRRKGKATRRVSCGQRIVIVLTGPAHGELPTRRSRQLSTSRKKTSRSADAALGWIAKSQAPEGNRPGSWARTSLRYARNWRRKRLRTTAVPTARDTANATRGGSSPLNGDGANMVTDTVPLRTRRPRRRSSWNVRRSRTRQIRPTDVDGP
jgi:hypothetical protein